MAMVVQHNITAMNANRNLGTVTSAQSKSAEKLSSGYRINRAADDAAGLTISEKMRKQMRGLTRASTNAQDGVSAVQTAEGALTEVHSMLQRMNELATQASNGTNSKMDRDAIQAEIDQLTTEIDRVAETTKFNEIYLLKGNKAGTSSDMKINAHDAGLAGKLTDLGDTASFSLDKALENGDKITIAGTEYTIGSNASIDSTEGYMKYDAATIGATPIQAGDSITFDDGAGNSVTKTFVNKIENDAAASPLKDAGTEFVVKDESGHEVTYKIAANTDFTKNEIKAADAQALIAEQLAKEGHTVTVTKAGGKDVEYEVVAKNELAANNEVSMADADVAGQTLDGVLAAANVNTTSANLQSVNLGGVETTFTSNDPISSADIESIISKMKAGDKFRVDGTDVIIIAEKTDIKKGEYTAEDALKAINRQEGDMDDIEFSIRSSNKEAVKLLAEKGIANDTNADTTQDFTGSGKFTVIGSPAGSDKAEGNVLTVNEAYAKITEELEKASSIGTDEGKGAKVTNNGNGSFTIEKGTANVKDSLSFNLHVGADADMTNKINVNVESMSAASLGVKGISVTDEEGTNATYAIDAIADAISKVSSQRSALGAVQNRLEHTIANLDNVVENTTAAESRIRDTDMATEMVEYSKNNILAQAGQSMLAQANQSTQGVLSLLQ